MCFEEAFVTLNSPPAQKLSNSMSLILSMSLIYSLFASVVERRRKLSWTRVVERERGIVGVAQENINRTPLHSVPLDSKTGEPANHKVTVPPSIFC